MYVKILNRCLLVTSHINGKNDNICPLPLLDHIYELMFNLFFKLKSVIIQKLKKRKIGYNQCEHAKDHEFQDKIWVSQTQTPCKG